MKTDPINIYLHGNSFCEAFMLLVGASDNPNRNTAVGMPIMVASALASELLLKCLICMETGVSVRGHRLAQLFDRLSQPVQDRIEREWDKEVIPRRFELWDVSEREFGRPIPRRLRPALTAGDEAYRDMRYAYEEGRADRICFVLYDLPIALKRVILELRPDWRNVSRRLHPLEKVDAPHIRRTYFLAEPE